MGTRSFCFKALMDVDMPAITEITEETIRVTQQASYRFRSSARLATGRIMTTEEIELRRKYALSRPLP